MFHSASLRHARLRHPLLSIFHFEADRCPKPYRISHQCVPVGPSDKLPLLRFENLQERSSRLAGHRERGSSSAKNDESLRASVNSRPETAGSSRSNSVFKAVPSREKRDRGWPSREAATFHSTSLPSLFLRRFHRLVLIDLRATRRFLFSCLA